MREKGENDLPQSENTEKMRRREAREKEGRIRRTKKVGEREREWEGKKERDGEERKKKKRNRGSALLGKREE